MRYWNTSRYDYVNLMRPLNYPLPHGMMDNYRTSVYTYLVECLCKHVIRKYPSRRVQLKALEYIGFNIKLALVDSSEPKILSPALTCILCISIACFLTIASYLRILTWAGFGFRDNIPWFTWPRVFQWTFGSIVSYTMAIFIAIAIEKSSKGIYRSLPRFMKYLVALIFSTLLSLTFFRFANPDRLLKWEAFISLALSMGIICFAVIRSLAKPTAKNTRESIVSSITHAMILGGIATFFQVLAALFFRGAGEIATTALVISGAYGFAKGFIVTFIASFIIQESIRIQLVVGQRKSPRVRFRINLPAILNEEEFNVTIRDISMGGLQIEPGRHLEKGERVELTFDFADIGTIQGIVQWASKQFAGLAFTEENQNNEVLRNFMSNKFGPEFI